MTDIEKVKESVELQMELSKMLNKELKIVDCWHEWETYPITGKDISKFESAIHNVCAPQYLQARCVKCSCSPSWEDYTEGLGRNPNLFGSWTGFGIVCGAVKDDEGFRKKFVFNSHGMQSIYFANITVPGFALEMLKWKNPKGLEKVMGGEK